MSLLQLQTLQLHMLGIMLMQVLDVAARHSDGVRNEGDVLQRFGMLRVGVQFVIQKCARLNLLLLKC